MKVTQRRFEKRGKFREVTLKGLKGVGRVGAFGGNSDARWDEADFEYFKCRKPAEAQAWLEKFVAGALKAGLKEVDLRKLKKSRLLYDPARIT